MRFRFALVGLSCLVVRAVWAEPAHTVRVAGIEQFAKGDPVSTSIDDQGLLRRGYFTEDHPWTPPGPVSALRAAGSGLWIGTAGAGLFFAAKSEKPERIHDADRLVVGALAATARGAVFATNPDGKLYSVQGRVTRTLRRPEARYIWDLLPREDGLWMATGAPGSLHFLSGRKLEKVFAPEETHLRVLASHPKGGVVAGGGEKGIVYHVPSVGGRARVLYDSKYTECTALAVDPRTHTIYAAFVSDARGHAAPPTRSVGPIDGESATVKGFSFKGSELVQIDVNGHVQRLWRSRAEGIVAAHFDKTARRLFFSTATASPRKARLYQVDPGPAPKISVMARVDAVWLANLVGGAKGTLRAAASAPTRLVTLRPEPRRPAIYLSAETDMGDTASVGRVWFDAIRGKNAGVRVSVRTGQTEDADETWSRWSRPASASAGQNVSVPAGRYIQFRAELTGDAVIRALYASAQRPNRPPLVSAVFPLVPGTYISALPKEAEREQSATLSDSVLKKLTAPRKAKSEHRIRHGRRDGAFTVAWKAADPNGDELAYQVFVRREEPRRVGAWIELARDHALRFFSFDATKFIDGRYVARVVASDAPSNPPGAALEAEQTSLSFVLDQSPPTLGPIRVTPAGKSFEVSLQAEDAWSPLVEARASLGHGPWMPMLARDGAIDAPQEVLVLRPPAGSERLIRVEVWDAAGNVARAERR